MSNVVNSLRWVIGADSSQFRSEFDRARKAAGSSAAGINKSISGVNSQLRTMRNVLLGVLGAGTFGAVFSNIAKTADEISKMSESTGISVESLSTWGFALEQAGGSLEMLGAAVRPLIRNMDAARRGLKEQSEAFDLMNISVTDSNGLLRSAQDILLDMADVFSQMEDGATKTALATQLLGRSGAQLIPFLNQGRDGIGELTERARELGLEISTEAAYAAAEFNDLLNDLKRELTAVAQGFALEAIPAMTEWVRTVRFARAESGNLTAAWVALGGIGSALFDETTADRIRNINIEIQELESALRAAETAAKKNQGIFARMFGADYEARAERLRGRIAALRDELEQLEPIQARQDAADKARLEALRKQREEEEARRRAFTEALRAEQERRVEEARAAKEREAIIKRGEQAIVALEREVELAGKVSREQRVRFDIEKGAYADLEPAQQRRLIAIARELDQQAALTDEQERAQREAEEYAKTMDRLAQRVMESVKTEAQLLTEEVDTLNQLLEQGRISWQVYSLAMQDADRRMREIKGASEEANDAMSVFADQAARNAQTAFADFLFDPFANGLKGMVRQFADAMRRILAEALAARALTALGIPGLSGGGAVPGFAHGGPVRGPGTSTSDSIPARLSANEFVQPAKATRYYGMDAMEALRRRAVPREALRSLMDGIGSIGVRRPRFARFNEGGLVDGQSSEGGNVRIVNVIDPAMAEEYMTSSAGERVMMNFIKRNSSAVRNALGS